MSTESVEPEEGEILAAAKSGNPLRLDRAIRWLTTKVLVPVAARTAGKQSRQADLQPESVVDSVVAKELADVRRILRFESESHLRGWLVAAVRNMVLTRLRKGGRTGRPVQLSPMVDGGLAPQARGPGPRSEVEQWHDGRRLADHLLASAKDDVDRNLIREFVLAGGPWADAARAAGVTEATARQRLSRMRKALLAGLVEPIRLKLDGPSWAIAEAILIERQPPDQVARHLGITQKQLSDHLSRRIWPRLEDEWGSASGGAISRLIGRK